MWYKSSHMLNMKCTGITQLPLIVIKHPLTHLARFKSSLHLTWQKYQSRRPIVTSATPPAISPTNRDVALRYCQRVTSQTRETRELNFHTGFERLWWVMIAGCHYSTTKLGQMWVGLVGTYKKKKRRTSVCVFVRMEDICTEDLLKKV